MAQKGTALPMMMMMMIIIIIKCPKSVRALSGDALDSYSGGTRFEFRREHRLF
jgi:hypothetical protein